MTDPLLFYNLTEWVSHLVTFQATNILKMVIPTTPTSGFLLSLSKVMYNLIFTLYHKFVFWFPQANDLTPQVVKAARIVLLNPNNAASVEHFDLLKKQWTENMEKLRGLVDEATDTVAFIKATGQY